MADKFNQYLNNLLGVEGGYTSDHRGATNYGVSQPTYDGYLKEKKMPSKKVKDLTYGEVKDFYQTEFYAKPKIDKVADFSPSAAGVLFDHAVNAGNQTAIKHLQQVVGSKDDGVIGEKTLKAVEDYVKKNGDKALSKAILKKQADHYAELVTKDPDKYGKYLNGWKNRITKTTSLYASEQ